MTARVDRGAAAGISADAVEAELRALGGEPWRWGVTPGATYGWHRHELPKTLYCVAGSIVFHTHADGDFSLQAGDRLHLPAGTDHAATAGDDGVECVEAYVPTG